MCRVPRSAKVDGSLAFGELRMASQASPLQAKDVHRSAKREGGRVARLRRASDGKPSEPPSGEGCAAYRAARRWTGRSPSASFGWQAKRAPYRRRMSTVARSAKVDGSLAFGELRMASQASPPVAKDVPRTAQREGGRVARLRRASDGKPSEPPTGEGCPP